MVETKDRDDTTKKEGSTFASWEERLKAKGVKVVKNQMKESIVILNPHPNLVRELLKAKAQAKKEDNDEER